jgi:hypothetical protein
VRTERSVQDNLAAQLDGSLKTLGRGSPALFFVFVAGELFSTSKIHIHALIFVEADMTLACKKSREEFQL